ncbi:DinB family protein [Fulvivirgaceae bacterium BMA12]|uniref:DinB family protein n=1 Tax=Agaribacillus aureus TaxID=3051825 RepID=A0ABT8LA33_9BACT|nr:DinB family protein [Fulvivirgaceae bacterium BMA12]
MLAICKDLEKTIEEVDARLSLLNETDLNHKPSLQKWSKKEILGHLIDSANNNLNRFIRGQYLDEPHIVYDQDQWVSIQNYQAMPLENVQQLWKIANLQIVNVLKNMPQKSFEKKCDTGKEQKELHTLSWLANDYLAHLHHHLNQIFSHS